MKIYSYIIFLFLAEKFFFFLDSSLRAPINFVLASK